VQLQRLRALKLQSRLPFDTVQRLFLLDSNYYCSPVAAEPTATLLMLVVPDRHRWNSMRWS
jgi:hypothetical protein